MKSKIVFDDALPKTERSRAFYKAAERVAKYVGTLPLTDAQTKRLLALLADQVDVAESDAACQGAKIGMEHAMAELALQLSAGSQK